MNYYDISLPVTGLLDRHSPTLIVPESKKKLREYVERFARYFKRELQMDFIQFEASETPDTSGYVPYEAYLFHDRAYDVGDEDSETKERCLGACCFRWIDWENAPASWSFEWVWIHPFRRGRGILRKAWPDFRRKYGEFHVAPPYSPAMEKFLERIRNEI